MLMRAAALAVPLMLAACGGVTPPEFVGGSRQSAAVQSGSYAAPVPANEASFAFDPFSGAPGNTLDDLSRKIGEAASKEGLTLVRRAGARATYRVKGHLSAVGDNTASTILYVFDVYDGSGRRVHRFSGQETSNATSADPWAGISGETLNLIATRTVLALKAWLTRAGS
ncbi:hypothetical protein D1F64_17345 [Breoghania sp. L-A4]|nr:hypothetical protein D1F64_17345 [Breoghania sp. L-A4]